MIASLSNPKVKYVRRLQADRRFRYRERAFVIEGDRWLTEALQANWPMQLVFYESSWADAHPDLLAQLPPPALPVTAEIMAAMSDTEQPAGICAVLQMASRPFPANPTLLLILDRIRTPGNLGAMLRTAAAAGADGVLLSPGCVDPYNPKVVRGSMGALLRLPVQSANWDEIALITKSMQVWAAAANGKKTYTAVDWTRPSAILIGSEASGAGEKALNTADAAVSIPMHDATESLNAAVAAAVLLFEARRQRTPPASP